jgi:hypothetical protein
MAKKQPISIETSKVEILRKDEITSSKDPLTIVLPRIPHRTVDGNRQLSDIGRAIKTMETEVKQSEHLTISLRAKSQDGDPYYSIGVLPLQNLKLGAEIVINGQGPDGNDLKLRVV